MDNGIIHEDKGKKIKVETILYASILFLFNEEEFGKFGFRYLEFEKPRAHSNDDI